jgi:hypothetical protein
MIDEEIELLIFEYEVESSVEGQKDLLGKLQDAGAFHRLVEIFGEATVSQTARGQIQADRQ